MEAQDIVRVMRPGDRQGPGARAVRGDCPSRLEGALRRARAASQEDGPAREQLGAQPRFGHRPAGSRCGFAQVPGPGEGQGRPRAATFFVWGPGCVPEPGSAGSWSWDSDEQAPDLGTETVEGAETGRGEHPGKAFEIQNWTWPRGLQRSGDWGSAKSPGKDVARAGLPELSRAGDAAGARAGRVRAAGALLGGQGRSSSIVASAQRTLLPETVRDGATESRLGLQWDISELYSRLFQASALCVSFPFLSVAGEAGVLPRLFPSIGVRVLAQPWGPPVTRASWYAGVVADKQKGGSWAPGSLCCGAVFCPRRRSFERI